MSNSPVAHETITICRTIKASLDQVFAAWADPAARTQWGPPSDDEAIAFLESDFRVGGKDISLCGQKGDLRFRVETHYYEIDEPRRLLFTESVSTDDALLCVSLVTVDMCPAGDATQLDLTVQVASLVGVEMIAGSRGGWTAAIEHLVDFLDRA